jgi:RES domain-containing protein
VFSGVPVNRWGTVTLSCPNCNEELALGDLVVPQREKFRQELVAAVGHAISEAEIAECQYCNSGQIWYEYGHGDSMNLKDIGELLDDYGVPEDLYDDVLRELRCSNCQSRFGGTDEPYVTARDLHNWYGDLEDVLVRTFGLERWDTRAFVNWLIKYPMLGLSHDIGQKIHNTIRAKTIPGFMQLSPGQVLYRARRRDVSETPQRFEESQMWAPPLGKASHGRFNPIGVPVLYLADSPKTCVAEIGGDEESAVDMAEFVLLEAATVWDLRKTDLLEFVSALSQVEKADPGDYAFSNFLSQCCSAADVSAIVYASVKRPKGVNTAFLNYVRNRTLGVRAVFTMP